MSRPVWAAGLLVLALALPAQAASDSMPAMPLPPSGPAAPPSAPAPLVAEATAIQVARSLFATDLVKGQPTVEYGPDYRGGTAWNISWEGAEMIHVSVDGHDGQVLSVDRWRMGPDRPSTTRLTKEEAAAKAAQWLARLAPGAQSSLVVAKPNPDYWYGADAYSFRYDWQALGYPVPGAGASLRLDPATGELASWYIDRPQGRLVLPPAILAESEARAAFMKLPLSLRYMRAYWADEAYYKERPASPTMLLAYRPRQDAALTQSGTFIGPDGQPLPDVTIPTFKQVPPPFMPYKPPAEPLSREASLAIAQALSGQNREPDEVSVYRWDDRLSFNFGWIDWAVNPSESESDELRVSVDAKRGLVEQVYSGMDFRTGQPSITPAEAQQIAVDFLITYRPDLAGVLYYPAVGPERSGRYFQVSFERQYEGITIDGYGGADLTVDGLTGRVISFFANENKNEVELDLPKPEGVLPPGPLMAKLVEFAGLELGWVPVQPAEGEPYLQLVWHLARYTPVTLIEAQTGIFRDMDGTDILKFRRPPTDVAGHWAELEIESLFDRRIVTVEDGLFKPDQAMTWAEASAWLDRLNYGGPRPFIEGETPFGSTGIAVGEPNPATPITREAFVQQVVVALGYERIAGMPNEIWMGFHDKEQIEPGARNAVAVLNGLGVIRGTPEGYFLPKKSLTRAEAARILFQSLEHRRFGGYYYK